MTDLKRRLIEAAGFRVTTVQEFLGLSDEENDRVETMVSFYRRIEALTTSELLDLCRLLLEWFETDAHDILDTEAIRRGVWKILAGEEA